MIHIARLPRLSSAFGSAPLTSSLSLMLSTPVVVLMGVSGVGKTTVGRALASRLGWAFADADDLHPAANVARMARGEGLTDADRGPWLDAVRRLIDERLAAGPPTVLACSALKARYRDRLRASDRVRFVWLEAPPPVLAQRLERRGGHFAGPDLLPSQFEALEPPRAHEAVAVSATGDVEPTVQRVLDALEVGDR